MNRGLAAFARSGAWSVVAQAIQIVGALGLSVVVVRSLTPEEFGTLSVARQASHLVVIVSGFALERVSLRFLPELWKAGDVAAARRFLVSTAAVRILAWAVLWVGVLLLGDLWDRVLGFAWQRELGAGVLTALIFSLHNQIRAAATARFATRTVAIGTAAGSVAMVVATVLLLRGGAGVVGVLWGAGIGMAVAGILTWPAAWGVGERARGTADPSLQVGGGRFLRYAGPFAGIAILNHVVHSQTEIYFLARFHGEELAGLFSLGFTFAQRVIDFLPLALWEVSMAGFSHLVVSEPERIPTALHAYLTLLYLALVPLAFGGIAFSGSLLQLLYTADYSGATLVSQAYFLIAAIAAFNAPVGMMLYARERSGAALRAYVVVAVVNVGLDLALIPAWGLWGAVIALGAAKILNLLLFARLVWSMMPGLQVPWAFLGRAVLASAPVLAWLLVADRWTAPWQIGLGLLAAGGVLFLGFRIARVVGPEEARLVRDTQLPLGDRLVRWLGAAPEGVA